MCMGLVRRDGVISLMAALSLLVTLATARPLAAQSRWNMDKRGRGVIIHGGDALPDLARGKAAAAAGRVENAQRDLTPLAQRGYFEAQLILRRLYAQHKGTPRVLELCRGASDLLTECYVDLVRDAHARGDSAALHKLGGGAVALLERGALPARVAATVARVLITSSVDAVFGADPAMSVVEAEPAASATDGRVDLAERIVRMLAQGTVDAQVEAAGVVVRYAFVAPEFDAKSALEHGRASQLTAATLFLGQLYLLGQRTAHDPQLAHKYLSEAAKRPETATEARYALGRLFQRGYLDETDPERAHAELLAAARAGHPSADAALSRLYDSTRGVRMDAVHAYVFAELAAQQGERAAVERRDQLRAALPSDALAVAQQRVQQELDSRVLTKPREMRRLASPAQGPSVDFAWKSFVSTELNGSRDAGLLDRKDSRGAYLHMTPWAHVRLSRVWSGFARLRLIAATDSLPRSVDDNYVGSTDKAVLGLKELWIDYGGLTSYPSESLRFGRQRMRQDDTQFWDVDIDALRWQIHTTLVRAELGVGRELSTYRTDSVALPPAQKGRLYSFATLSYEWRPQGRIGLRAMHASDSESARHLGASVDHASKLHSGELTWLGLFANNHYYDGVNSPNLAYDASFTWLSGNVRTAFADARREHVIAVDEGGVQAWAADLSLRYRLPFPDFPLQLGAAGMYSSGGRMGEAAHQYLETGLQSNYCRFTGTRAMISRFTDAYRVERGNVRVATLFASINLGRWDGSLIYSNYHRIHSDAPVVATNMLANPPGASHELGNGYDIVVTRYVSLSDITDQGGYLLSDEHQSSIRFRGSVFDPSAAYADGDLEYRAALELTLWL